MSLNLMTKLFRNIGFVFFAITLIACGKEQPALPPAEQVEGEVLVKFRPTVASAAVSQTLSHVGLSIVQRYPELGVLKCSLSEAKIVEQAVAECNADPNIEYAEPNYIYHTMATPNDPRLSSLWGMQMIDAAQAWDIQTGDESVLVGVIDTGINYEHEDLAANMWRNPGESGDGKENNNVDDDNNGFVDDVFGWDFNNDDSDPRDDNDHGSHVSGTIGAVGDNGKGVVGVNWDVSLMALKFLGADGSGNTADAIGAIVYATNMGAKVLNNSWGGGGRSQALEDAIRFANDNGVLFIAAAGNAGSNNDNFPSYPASYEVPNVVAVAASTEDDGLASFSNRGLHSVDLAAPGTNVLSTVSNGGYNSFSGTSMATPHVAGASALIMAQYPGRTVSHIKTRILGSVETSDIFADAVATGGRLNVFDALSTSPIIRTTRLNNTLDTSGPYVVEADIVDDIQIGSATLTYQVNAQDAVTVDMTAAGNDRYQADIPGQPLDSEITYSVSAEDDDGNQSTGREITFAIAEAAPPPTDGCGCLQATEVTLENPELQTTVNALVNVSLFLLPFVAIKVGSRRFKKRNS
ncbi:S8 family serine peptidase [candidate division KSB1 bacterium]|nr:S8 family serine peptidase [candidate division KSB1 bacterium]NIR71760.1 S8 family serine peptidase [candidate division KSB1 bacterium]NIS24916.1 S8 family serine peptidase [candidate division KSB1 bacterium]NIT71792.1 S8 family serine peptidase [candidate division KSB1 bacterium]NIU25530.1 S8 family serine peptidase [candidate division KSB1 bacterium]